MSFSPQKSFITDRNTPQFHQLSCWLVSDDPVGEEAGCADPGLVWLHVVCGCGGPGLVWLHVVCGCGGPGLVWLHVVCGCEASWTY